MNHVREVKNGIRSSLPKIIEDVNEALRGGESLKTLEPVLTRLGRGGQLPHWYNVLLSEGALPNLDGKTLGSVL
jgi:hypothetical protein